MNSQQKLPLAAFIGLLLASLVVSACSSSDPTATGPEPTPTRAPISPPASFPDVASVVEAVGPAVVQVLATVDQQNFFGQTTQGRSQGSGVFFNENGYILTNNHVVENASKVEIATVDRERLEVEVVGTDPETDLAVLRIDPRQIESLTIATLGDTDAMRIGEWVIAIGSPLGFEGSVTVGVISAKGRSLTIEQDQPELYDLVQTDAVINPGNSGGPLLNLRGEVIGINTAIIRGPFGSNGQEAQGIGFAVSMGTAVPVSQQIIDNGRVIRPRIGVRITDVTPVVSADRGLSMDGGVLIVSLAPDGPAERAGVQVNDVIVQVDGNPVTSTTELVRLFLTGYSVGDTVNIVANRSGVTVTFDLVLEEVN
jgi:serine protease Do